MLRCLGCWGTHYSQLTLIRCNVALFLHRHDTHSPPFLSFIFIHFFHFNLMGFYILSIENSQSHSNECIQNKTNTKWNKNNDAVMCWVILLRVLYLYSEFTCSKLKTKNLHKRKQYRVQSRAFVSLFQQHQSANEHHGNETITTTT